MEQIKRLEDSEQSAEQGKPEKSLKRSRSPSCNSRTPSPPSTVARSQGDTSCFASSVCTSSDTLRSSSTHATLSTSKPQEEQYPLDAIYISDSENNEADLAEPSKHAGDPPVEIPIRIRSLSTSSIAAGPSSLPENSTQSNDFKENLLRKHLSESKKRKVISGPDKAQRNVVTSGRRPGRPPKKRQHCILNILLCSILSQ